MARVLSIFVENKPGRLKSVTEVLAAQGINIIDFTIQDRDDFGLMKLLVDKPEPAYLALLDKGFAAALKEVLVVAIEDKPGNLYKLTELLCRNSINIVDARGFVGPNNLGVCCLELSAAQGVSIGEIVEKAGFKVLSEEHIHELL